jgi:transcriptional regulator with XRE-family HTH domain
MSTLKVVPDQPSRLTDRVADEVRANMARARMTQTDLAVVLGLTQSAVSKRLRGKIAFSVDELEKVADALGVHPAVLLGGYTPSPNRPVTGPYLIKSNTPRRGSTTALRVLSGSRGRPGVMRTTRTVAA